MHFAARRSGRPNRSRPGLGSSLETLEGRQLMAGGLHTAGSLYHPSDLPVRTVNEGPANIGLGGTGRNTSRRVLAGLDNDGKILTGQDRQGDEWTITVHGPGVVIVTDATPNDGVLDDDLDTIQLIGTDIHRTYVTGQTVASGRTVTTGEVFFNNLIAESGVASIILNGFTLARTVAPPVGVFNNQETGIELPGGVGVLQFHNIAAPIDQATGDQPINIVIGDPSTPLRVRPTIRLDSIFNTVLDSSSSTVSTVPQTAPTVNIIVNGVIHDISYVSSTAQPVDAASQFFLPLTGSTGRTAIRARQIGKIRVVGSARNTTFSRGAIPFENGFSGLEGVHSAEFGGNADALGIDASRGTIGRLRFARGLGDPTGTGRAATGYGLPAANRGYPANGYLGGLVTARRIGKIRLNAADTTLQTGQDPAEIQRDRTNTTRFFARPGRAITGSVIASQTDIGETNILGDGLNSEIKSGFDYTSHANGLEGTRSRSRIGRVHQIGDNVDTVISATYRPVDNIYGNGDDVAGDGRIDGSQDGTRASIGAFTGLGNQGVGYFARRKSRRLPPPDQPTRIHSVNTR